MKKVIPLIMIICLVFLFAGCKEQHYDDIEYNSSNLTTEQFLALYQDAYNKTRDITNLNFDIKYQHENRNQGDYKEYINNVKISNYQGRPIAVINDSNGETIYYLNKSMTNDVVSSQPTNTESLCNTQKQFLIPSLDSSMIVDNIYTKEFERTTYYKLNFNIEYVNNQTTITDKLITNSNEAYPDYIYSYCQEFGIDSQGYIVMMRITYELQQYENRSVYYWSQQTTDLLDYSGNMTILDDMTKLNAIINS